MRLVRRCARFSIAAGEMVGIGHIAPPNIPGPQDVAFAGRAAGKTELRASAEAESESLAIRVAVMKWKLAK